jgi:hypothetical protein
MWIDAKHFGVKVKTLSWFFNDSQCAKVDKSVHALQSKSLVAHREESSGLTVSCSGSGRHSAVVSAITFFQEVTG